MNTNKQLELGFRTYFQAIGFIFSRGLWWTFLFPVLLNVLLFVGGYSAIEGLTAGVQAWLREVLSLDPDSFFLAEYLGPALMWFVWIFLKIIFFFIFAYYGGYIVLAVLSPLLAYVSAKTEEIISGNQYPFTAGQLMRDMVRGLFIVLRNLVIQTGWTILLFAFGFIPVAGWVAPFVLFLVSAYFFGFSSIDYTSERRNMNIGESVQFVRRYKWLAVANGFVFCLILIIPLCGVLISGFAAIVSVVAATLAVNEIPRHDQA